MTLVDRPKLWMVHAHEVAFDVGLQKEYWDLFQMAIIGRDRSGYPGRRAFDAVTEIGVEQIRWTQEHQPFILHTWQGELSGSLRAVSDKTIFTGDQLVNEYQIIVNQTQGLDRLFLRSQLVASLLEQEKISGHDELFMQLRKINDSFCERKQG